MSNKSLEMYIANKRRRMITDNILKKSCPSRKKLVQSRLMKDVRNFESGNDSFFSPPLGY
jgi:hypothetical protein